MPQTGMDWWVVVGVLVAIVSVYFAWRQSARMRTRTRNKVEHGSGNELKGGEGNTINSVKHGDNNRLSG